MKDFSWDFPVLQSHVYLNTASCGLLSQSLVQWRADHDQRLLKEGSLYRDLHKGHIREIRAGIADLFTTPPSTVAMVPNFSFGMNAILDGIPRGQKVLLLQGDYPSINWPVEHRDFDVCYAQIDEHLEANIEQAVNEHRPDIFAFSLVQYISGIKIDFEFLQRLKAYHPQMLLIADGTQYLGTEVFRFSDSPIDVIGASCYKWMLAGYGNGIFMISPAAQQRIWPKTIGFNSADAAYSKRDAIEFIGRLEPGHQDTLNYGSLGHSIESMQAIGVAKIDRYLNELCGKAKSAFAQLGLLEEATVNRSSYSTIFNIKAGPDLFEKLKDNHIVASLRGSGIRVSFHFYNTEDHLTALVDVLKKHS